MDNIVNIKNFVMSTRHKADELAREIMRFQCWLMDIDEIEAEARYLERESERLLKRAEMLRDRTNEKL